ncbi:MAG TPA: AbrB/MazE/SpoVT family DNA-binding domain-containing protein [Bryobacteraceae bacterium]|nr:AbrB/MazE/SpoVT family DNA-binding domain-containing protein [Bryobacteraceae bacterium]
MAIGHSKVTSQGQISVPAEVRKRLGVGPGSTLVWEEDGDRIVVRRSGLVSSEDIHRALFAERQPKPKSLKQLKEGLRDYTRKRHARG